MLLSAAKVMGQVRADVRIDEVLALLAATAQGALRGGWSADLRARVLTRVFAGLVP